jgi:hypothetical protein
MFPLAMAGWVWTPVVIGICVMIKPKLAVRLP